MVDANPYEKREGAVGSVKITLNSGDIGPSTYPDILRYWNKISNITI